MLLLNLNRWVNASLFGDEQSRRGQSSFSQRKQLVVSHCIDFYHKSLDSGDLQSKLKIRKGRFDPADRNRRGVGQRLFDSGRDTRTCKAVGKLRSIALSRPPGQDPRPRPRSRPHRGLNLARPQSIWLNHFGEPGLFPTLKLTYLYREPSVSTSG